MRKIGICIPKKTNSEITPFLEMLKCIGFEESFTCHKENCGDIAKSGLKMTSFHAPFDGINAMWSENEEGETMLSRLLESVDICKEYDIPVSVIHLSSGDNSPNINDIGTARFNRLVDYAVKNNVKLAFENQRKLANLAYIFERYANVPQVGFCFDTGHNNCFAKDIGYMPIFADRMMYIHLNDNQGIKGNDQHLIPFDGNSDLEKCAKTIANSPYKGGIMLEVFKSPAEKTAYEGYEDLSVEQYYQRAFEAGKKFREEVEKFED